MSQVIQPIERVIDIEPESLAKQIIESQTHDLDMMREALSNMCAPEVEATEIEVQFFYDPKYGASFRFVDDGIGMNYTEGGDKSGRLNRFLNFGVGKVVGYDADMWGYKGIGSKLMLNARRLSIRTWCGGPDNKEYIAEVENPRKKLLEDNELPKARIFPSPPTEESRRGTEITVYGYKGGDVEFSFERLKAYMHWATCVGATKDEVAELLPSVYLQVGSSREQVPPGFPWIKEVDADSEDGWKTFVMKEPVTVTETTKDGREVQVVLKGGFTQKTGNACIHGYSISPHYTFGTNGLRLSIKGIPYFKIDYHALKGEKFKQYLSLVNFVVECDEIWEKLNIDRSNYNHDDPIAAAFERAVRKAFSELASSKEYGEYLRREREEDLKTKSQVLTTRKRALRETAEYVCLQQADGSLVPVHRAPENENDTLALFWKLEGMSKLPFVHLLSVEHTASAGVDVIANFQIADTSQRHYFEPVEFEARFSSFTTHGHALDQVSMIVCWEMDRTRDVEAIEGKPYLYRYSDGENTVLVLELRQVPEIAVKRATDLEF